MPLAYVNLVGGQDELVFDGDSLVVDRSGEVLARGPQFSTAIVYVDLAADPTIAVPRSRRGWTMSKRSTRPWCAGCATTCARTASPAS